MVKPPAIEPEVGFAICFTVLLHGGYMDMPVLVLPAPVPARTNAACMYCHVTIGGGGRG